MAYAKISGFSDEVDRNIDEQFRVLNNLGIKYFEPRFIGGKNISELTLQEASELKAKMDKYGIKVSSIGSPLGKIKVSADFGEHLEILRRVVEIAKKLGTKYIRVFSFYPEVKGEFNEDGKKEVFSRLEKMIEYARENDVILLHENEKGIYGDTEERCLEIMEKFYCDNFKMVFDPANFVQCGVDTKKAYKLLSPYIEYMHIKDALFENNRVVPSGMGDGNVEYVLGELFKSGYNGYLSLEPHLGTFEGLSDLELDDDMLSLPKSGEGTFTIAYNALIKILDKLEVK